MAIKKGKPGMNDSTALDTDEFAVPEENYVTAPETGAVLDFPLAAANHHEEEDLPPFIDKIGGNYMLTIGMPGSGKTTFQNHLVRYTIEGCDDFIVDPLPIRGMPDTKDLLAHWRSIWAEGKLMTATDIGAPKEYAFKLTPIKGSNYRVPLEFGFYEVSGEKLKTVMHDPDGSEQDLPLHFHMLLDHEDVRLFIVLMCDGARPVHCNRLFMDFLSYVEERLTKDSLERLRETCRFMILVSKPRIAQTHVHRKAKSDETESQPVSVRFVDMYLSETRRVIASKWGRPPLIGVLDIGEIRRVKEQGTSRDKLTHPEFEHIGKIFNQIYRHFTGTTPSPSFAKRIVSFFSQ